MREDGAFTTPEQRFFLPLLMEAEHHSSFSMEGQPSVEVMDGSVAYVVTGNSSGGETASLGDKNALLQSGSAVKRVVTTDAIPEDAEKLPVINEEDPAMCLFEEPADSYEPQEGDLLILKLGRTHLPEDSPLRAQINEDGVMLLPAEDEIPYLDMDGNEPADFNLMGIIKADKQQLLVWENGYGYESQRGVDLSVVNANVQNTLEVRLLADRMNTVGSESLRAVLSLAPAAQAYLKYFDMLKGSEGRHIPSGKEDEPYHKLRQAGQLTPDQQRRYELIAEAMAAATRL